MSENAESDANRAEPASAGAGPFRFSIVTLMALVLAASMLVALFRDLRRLVENYSGQDIFDLDAPFLIMIAIVLTSVALGAWRRATVAVVALVVATSCALVLILLLLYQAEWYRALMYWFQGVFGLTIVLPLLMLRLTERTPGRHRLLERMGEVLMGSGITLLLVVVGILLQVFLFEVVPSLF